MLRNCSVGLCVLTFIFSSMIPAACAQATSPALPYSPSLDATSLDRGVDPCVDLYQFSCGGWQKKNPIPADQTGWSVYGKMYEDNLAFLRGMLEEAEKPDAQRNAVTQKIGDFYGACMDESRGGEARSSADPGTTRGDRGYQVVERPHAGVGAAAVYLLPVFVHEFHAVFGGIQPGSGRLRAGDRRRGPGRPGAARPRLLPER